MTLTHTILGAPAWPTKPKTTKAVAKKVHLESNFSFGDKSQAPI